MAKFVVPIGGSNLPKPRAGALTVGGGVSVGKADGGGRVPSLAASLLATQEHAKFKQKPYLIYLIVDLTNSRDDTRAVMRDHERDLAQKIMQAGGDHPVVCMGVFHRGGQASRPIELKTSVDVLRFLDTDTMGGGTDIAKCLSYYLNHNIEAVLSRAILIGDANDGEYDGTSRLVNLARELGENKRPVIVAHQETGHGNFCTDAAPKIADASGGLEFSLGTQPRELHAMLENDKRMLTATPDELRATANGASGGIQFSGSQVTKRFAAAQAQLLLTQG